MGKISEASVGIHESLRIKSCWKHGDAALREEPADCPVGEDHGRQGRRQWLAMIPPAARGSVKVWTLIPKDKMSVGGWSGILEDRCVPSDESLFNEVRDRAAGIGAEE